MENVTSSTTGTKVDPGESQYGSLVSQAYYQQGFNNGTNNIYGVGNMYERPSPQAPGHGEASFPQQAQPYGGTEAPTIMASGANLLTQPHAPHANPSTFSSYSLPAPPPYAPHPNPMFGTLPVDHSGAGSLHLTSEQSLDQYLSTPQTHLLQLRGTNPVSQQPPTNNFPLYGMPERPQRFPAIHNLPFQTDPNLKQSTVVPIHEDDSSSAFREASSHINRKKRKACGRCGPCQRKDNCGTCMNCVNRAKGKQICIYRKCEELKKKPGTETYATSTTPDHQVEPVTVRQEKRKELEQLYSERKRSRTEESTGLVQQGTTLPHQKFPAFTATQHNFGQQPNPSTSFPQQQSYAGVPHSSSSPFQQQILQNSSPHSYPLTQNSAHIPGSSGEQAQTTDIISEALREIEHTTATENVGDLASVLNQGPNSARSNKEVSNPNYNPNQQSNYQQWNVQQSVEGVQQQQTPSLLQAQLQGEIRLPGQPPPLPPGPGPGSQSLHTGINHYQTCAPAGTQALPDQLLSNLTRFNEFGSFQKSAPSLNQSGNGKQPISVSCANYEATPINSQSTEQKFQAASTIDDNQLLSVIVPTVSTATQQAPFDHILVTSDSSNMYRNTSTLAYSMSYANEGSVQTMDPKVTNPLAPQLHRPYNHLGQPNLHGAPTQNFRAMIPQMTNMRYAASPAMHPPHRHYAGQNTRMPVHRFQINVAKQSPDPSYAASAMEQKHRNLNQATSNNAMSGYPSQPPDYVKKEQKEFGQGYFNQQYQPKQWDNPMMGNQNPIGSVSSIANQGLVKQEIISPKASHSALHSPVSSTNQETGDHSSTISHMPELAPSPIPHASGLDLNSVKAEEKGDILNQQVFNNNVSEGKIQSVEQAQEVTSATQNFNMHSAPLMGHHSGGAVGFQYAQPHGSSPGQPVFTVNQTNHVNDVFQSHIAKQNNINNGTAIHAAMHPQSTPLENTLMLPSATSNSNISCWQPMQHSEPSTNIASVASQSDTNLTISPGESGYDSAEIVQEAHTKQHQIGTSQSSSQNHVSSVPSSLETKESPKGGSHLKTSASSSNQDSIGPKNLYRAPVGAKAGTLNNPAAYQLSYKNNDLPSAGACALKHKQFSRFLTNSNDAANFNIKGTPTSMSKRSLSCDDAIYSTRSSDKEEEKKVVRLRRFSNQESSGTAQKEFVSTHLLQLSKRELDEEKLKRQYHSFPNDFAEHVKQDEVWKYNIPKPDMKLLSMSKNHDAVYPQRRLVPFDTPPVTPCSADFSVRQTSVDNTIESNLGVNKISDILPTPPHTSDTPMGKFTANGFASPAYENSDFKLQNVHHDLQPNMQFEAEPTSHRGCRVQTETGSPSKTEFAKCNCIEGTDGRNDEAPYYTHLGAAESISGIRQLFEKRTGYTGNAIRIEKVIYTGKEGKTSTGCPMAKWIIRRSSEEEKILVVCRQRPGHRCPTAVITVIILLWDGVTRPLADFAYTNFTDVVPKHGEPTERRCATNDERTCACQGFNEETCGASFSFGCSWSMYYNGCKFARSNQPNKYKLNGTKDPDAENFIGKLCERLATVMSPLYQMAAPDAFQNQVEFEEDSSECRLGEARGPKTRPFSGVTSCIDFSAHAHKDQHNIDNGSTVVVTFTKPELRQVGIKPEDEQLHVLPLCKLDFSNEDGSCEGVAEKISSGAIEILDRWQHEVRTRKEPKLSKKQKTRAVKKKNGPGFDSTDSPPYKRRGRPPKQDRAMENTLNEQNNHLSVNNNMMTSKMTDFAPGSSMFQSPPRPQLLVPGPQAHQTTSPNVHPQFSNPCSPTRWPYRRQAPPTPHSANPFSPPPISSPRFEAKQAQTPTGGKDDNLPSIGDFFHPGQAPNDPTDNTQQVTSAECHPATPLPSINDVVGHPFHQNFSSVQGGYHVRNITPGTPAHNPNMPPSTPHYQDAAIHLKAYVSHAGPNQTCMENFENLPQPTSYQPYDISYSDSEENFRDQNIGGVAVAPGHGSVLIECAKKELHATTALKKPNRFYPTRISLVFYLHKSMNARNHGAAEYEAKEEERRKLKEEKKLEEMLKARQIEDSLNSARLLPGMPDQTIRYQNSVGQYAMMPNHAAVWHPASVSHSMSTSTPPHVQNNIRMVSPAPYHNIIDKSRQENMDQARFKLRERLTMASQDNVKRHFANQMQGTSQRPHLSEPTSLQMSHANAMISPKMPQQQYLSTSRERMAPEGYRWPNSLISQHRLAPPEVKGMHLYNQQGIDAMRQKHLTASQSSNYPRTCPMMDPSTIHSETRNQGSSHIAPNLFDNRVNYMRSPAYHGYQMQNPHLVQQQYMMRQETHRFPIAPDQGINRQSPMYAHMPNKTFSSAPPPYQFDQSRRSLSNTSHGYGASPYGTLPGAYNPPVTQ